MGLDDEGVATSDASALVAAARDGDVERVTSLLASGVSAQACDPGSGVSVLSAAAEASSVEAVQVLLAAGTEPGGAGPSDTSPLVEAARAGSPEIVRIFLDAGADPGVRVRGQTALDVAVWQGHFDVVDVLRAGYVPQPVSDPHGEVCAPMREFLADPRVPVSYDPRFRAYSLLLFLSSASQDLGYCPWCGAELPGSLRDAFFDEMDALGIDYPQMAPPAGYLDDTWWRLRSGGDGV